jgi:hypothetical protein
MCSIHNAYNGIQYDSNKCRTIALIRCGSSVRTRVCVCLWIPNGLRSRNRVRKVSLYAQHEHNNIINATSCEAKNKSLETLTPAHMVTYILNLLRLDASPPPVCTVHNSRDSTSRVSEVSDAQRYIYIILLLLKYVLYVETSIHVYIQIGNYRFYRIVNVFIIFIVTALFSYGEEGIFHRIYVTRFVDFYPPTDNSRYGHVWAWK